MASKAGSQRLGDLFEKIRSRRVEPSARYHTDDVIAVLGFLSRGYNAAEIERRTLIGRSTITKWQNAFLNGNIEVLYPDIRERMDSFDLSQLPPERVRRVRPLFSWRESQTRLEDRPNPYNGSGHDGGEEDPHRSH